ncbi:MAG: DUF4984 domain-containing protein [Bacteroidales bacterium]|nr:DUF4984 domain-containing protein [Bacteroidales bacterium]
MNRLYRYITLAFVAAISLAGCHERYVTYSDAEYIMFADTMALYPVQAKGTVDKTGKVIDTTFTIPVVSTVKRDYDRTFGVEIIDKGSNAIERYHYRLESNMVTIKAGELRADVLVHGYYNNIDVTDSLGFELQLVMDDKLVMPLYGKNTKVVMMKSCPLDINDFTGYCIFTSMFLYQYSATGSYQRLIRTERLDDNTIICRNWLADGYDVTLTFNNDDPMKPLVTMADDQVASDEGSIFGQTHGDNRILVTHSPAAESIYYPCGKYLYLWAHFYVENLGTPVGTVGHFYNIMEWISDEEAERLQKVEGM